MVAPRLGGGRGAVGILGSVPTLRLFAAAREAAGTGRDLVPGATVGEVLDEACDRYGDRLRRGAGHGQGVVQRRAGRARPMPVTDADEVAVLPPVSGGLG